jgi:hypothetical protein
MGLGGQHRLQVTSISARIQHRPLLARRMSAAVVRCPTVAAAVVHLIKCAYLLRRAGPTGRTGRIVGNAHAAIILRKCE